MINEAEATIVRDVFSRYLALDSVLKVMQELNDKGTYTKRVESAAGAVLGEKPFNKLMVSDAAERSHFGEGPVQRRGASGSTRQ